MPGEVTAAGAGHAAKQLLEREHELARLRALLEDAMAGAGRLLLVEGPPGAGKSALLRPGEALGRARDLRTLTARGSELETDYPFALATQLFGDLLAAPSRERDLLFEGAASLARRLLEESAPEDSPAADAAHALLHGLYWLTYNASQERGLLLSIDDVHWADAASLRFLVYLAQRLEGLPVAVVLGARPQEPGTETELLARLRSHPLVEPLSLHPLSETATVELLSRALEAEPEEEFARACHAATGGNPFYLHELIAELRGGGIAPVATEAGRLRSLRPSGIAHSVLFRLGRLPPAAARLARTVAILGDGARLADAAELAGLDLETARGAADELADASILRAEETLSFIHPIVRAAVHADLPALKRAAEHGRAARLLAASGASPEEVAAHLLAAEPSSDAWVVDQLSSGASRALERGAPEAAVAYLRRALDEPPSRHARADLLRALGTAEAQADDPAAAEHLREALRITEHAAARASTALALGRVLLLIGRPDEALDVFYAGVEEARGNAPELAARLASEAIIVERGVLAGPTAVDRLEELRRELPADSGPDALVLATLAVERFVAGEPAAVLAEQALAGGRLLRDQGPGSAPYATTTNTLIYSDRFESARQAIDDALAHARARGSLAGFASASTSRAILHRRTGALLESEADARAALEAADTAALQTLVPFMLAQLIEALIERGETAAASAALERAGGGGPIPPVLPGMFLLASRGCLRLASGAPQEALADLEACGQRLVAGGVVNPALIRWRSRAAFAALALGDRAKALALAKEELELARRTGVATATAGALRSVAAAEGGDTAIDHLQEAAAVLDPLPPNLERAHVLVDLGAALRRSNRRGDAREPLREGLELARSFGAEPLAERGATELEAAGARPRTPLRTGVDALTPSERRIAAMAAEGLSNPELAQALFVTTKTVETHLSSAYRKLGIGSRAELDAALAASEQGSEKEEVQGKSQGAP
ncbi:MAG: AAA family ATPase [Actinomycetota bacterium]|nr:AAA family ATPase [Actinomycetota bacterium]